MGAQTDVDEMREQKRLLRQEANRVRRNERYATDPEFRAKCLASSRHFGAQKRAKERERKLALVDAGEAVSVKPGRPQRLPFVPVKAAGEAVVLPNAV